MRAPVQTCLLLLVGVLASPGRGGTIHRIFFDGGGEERTTIFPLLRTNPPHSHPRHVRIGSWRRGGGHGSRVALENVSNSTAQPLPDTSTGAAQQEGNAEPTMQPGPLLDEDKLVAFEVSKSNATLPPPTITSGKDITTPVPAAAGGDKGIPSELSDVLLSIFEESAAREKLTTTTQHPRVDITSRRPPVSSAGDVADFNQFLPHLEEVLKGVLVSNITEKPQTPHTVHLPPTQPPKKLPSDAEKDLRDILPAIEEALGSILNGEAKLHTTTVRPVLPAVHPTATVCRECFAAVLPQLKEAIRSVLEEVLLEHEAAANKHTSPPSAWQPSPPPTKDSGFGNFLPELKRMFEDILRKRQSDHSTTLPNTSTVKTPIPPVTAPTEQPLSFQNNVIEPESPTSDSGSLLQAIKSTLQDVLDHHELEAKGPQKHP